MLTIDSYTLKGFNLKKVWNIHFNFQYKGIEYICVPQLGEKSVCFTF